MVSDEEPNRLSTDVYAMPPEFDSHAADIRVSMDTVGVPTSDARRMAFAMPCGLSALQLLREFTMGTDSTMAELVVRSHVAPDPTSRSPSDQRPPGTAFGCVALFLPIVPKQIGTRKIPTMRFLISMHAKGLAQRDVGTTLANGGGAGEETQVVDDDGAGLGYLADCGVDAS